MKHLILLLYIIGAIPVVLLVGVDHVTHNPLIMGYAIVAGGFVRAAYRR